MNRKDFIYKSALGLATLSISTSYAKQKTKRIPKTDPQTAIAPIGDIRAILLHLGRNMARMSPIASQMEQYGATIPPK